MAHMIGFKDRDGGSRVFVNPGNVRLVAADPGGSSGTDIVFANGHGVTVADQLDDVIAAINAGL